MDLHTFGGATQLVVVTGKGGTGKSTIAAALGVHLAEGGRRVALLEADARESLHQLLGTPPSAGQILPAGPRLWHQNVEPSSVVERLVHRRLPLRPLADAVTRSAVFTQLVEGSPGLKEMAVLGHALELARGEVGPGVDTVILDAPATGHGLALLEAPRLVTDAVRVGPIHDLARQVRDLVEDERRSRYVVVTLAEEMPVSETLELVAGLAARVGRRPAVVVANALWPAWPGADLPPAWREAGELWRVRADLNARELERLAAAWPGPLVRLPLLAEPAGPALTQAAARALAAGAAP